MYDENYSKIKTLKPRFKQVKNAEELLNIAYFHLHSKDYMIRELEKKLLRNLETYDGDRELLLSSVIGKLKDFGYIKTDLEFGKRFTENALSNEYGLGFIRSQLAKKGMSSPDIELSIENALTKKHYDFFQFASNRLNNRFPSGFCSTSRESVINIMKKYGFSSEQTSFAINNHPKQYQLQTKQAIKGAKANIEKEVLKLAKKMKGYSAIKNELLRKQIDISSFDSVISELESSNSINFFDAAKERLNRKRFDLKSQKGNAAAFNYLLSNGFNCEQIRYAISELK